MSLSRPPNEERRTEQVGPHGAIENEAVARTMALAGLDGYRVRVRARIAVEHAQVPRVCAALPLREVTERVRAAVCNSGEPWPVRPVVLDTHPDQLRMPPGLDLAVAVAVLAAQGVVPDTELPRTVFFGALGPDGSVRTAHGVLTALRLARTCRFARVIVSADQLPELAHVDGIEVLGARTLADVAAWLRNPNHHLPAPQPRSHQDMWSSTAELAPSADLPGSAWLRSAAVIAAAGGHDVLLLRDGTGDDSTVSATALVRGLHALLPVLSPTDSLEATELHALAGVRNPSDAWVRTPPLITPLPTDSLAALLGHGVPRVRPGAVSLAHRGMLLLDRAHEFGFDSLAAIGRALGNGESRFADAIGEVRMPARCQLLLITGTCRCLAAMESECACTPAQRRIYQRPLPAPLLDRIDIRLPSTAVIPEELGTSTDIDVRARVASARERAARRWSLHGCRSNATVPNPVLRAHSPLSIASQEVLRDAVARGAVSEAGKTRALRVAWTVADLAERPMPTTDDIALALALRDRRTP